MNSFKLTLLVFLFTGFNCFAQSEAAVVKAVIDQMFDGMRKGDSALVHKVFIDEVKMETIVTSANGEGQLRTSSLSSFLQAVGTPHDEVWDERLLDYQITIEGAMAGISLDSL